jgi:methionyl-tRNA formyltransferase
VLHVDELAVCGLLLQVISPSDTYGSLYNHLAIKGAQAVVDTLADLQGRKARAIPQHDGRTSLFADNNTT